MLWRYTITLQENGGRLMLAGVERLFEPALAALRSGRAWLAAQQQDATGSQHEARTES